MAPGEDVSMVQVVVAHLIAESLLEVMWVSGHCARQGIELADEEIKLASAEYRLPV